MPKKILVIEDHEKLRKDMLEIIRFEGFVAEWSDNNLDGLQKIYTYAPNVVICASSPPQIDSYALLKRIKSDQMLADMRVIVITSRLATFDDQAREEFSNIVYLEKPFQAADFLHSVRTCARATKDALPPPSFDDQQLLGLLKDKLDYISARWLTTTFDRELRQLSRQYQAILLTLIELGYKQPLNSESVLLHQAQPDYNLYDRLIFTAQNMPDVELQLLMWNQAGYLLRTPLGVIKTTAYLLSRGAGGELSEKQAEYVQRIADQTDRLSAAYERLLSDARAKMEEWSANDTGSAASQDESKT
ncbi:MAG: response regulator [Chloroflexi bacterium]|nr:response regulator [Chloroflexota bacterium]